MVYCGAPQTPVECVKGSPYQKSKPCLGSQYSVKHSCVWFQYFGPPIHVLMSPIVQCGQSCYVPGTVLKAGDLAVNRTGSVFSGSFPSTRETGSQTVSKKDKIFTDHEACSKNVNGGQEGCAGSVVRDVLQEVTVELRTEGRERTSLAKNQRKCS